jgi:hypothetical protein
MNEMDILKRIIMEDGNCCWASPSICARCPLSKLKKKPNGSNMSCIEALKIEDLSEQEADAKYKEVAERLLLDEEIESILGGDDGSK